MFWISVLHLGQVVYLMCCGGLVSCFPQLLQLPMSGRMLVVPRVLLLLGM